MAELERYFAINGYHRASTVSERGEFAVRGGVIDVFPPGADEPVRLDLFGDTLDAIRAFDRETQRSTKQLKSRRPAAGQRGAAGRRRRRRASARAMSRPSARPGDDPLYAAVSEGARRAGLEHWLPLFYAEHGDACSTTCRTTR